MTNGLESLKETKTILLTTYKRDGTPVDTPDIPGQADRPYDQSAGNTAVG